MEQSNRRDKEMNPCGLMDCPMRNPSIHCPLDCPFFDQSPYKFHVSPKGPEERIRKDMATTKKKDNINPDHYKNQTSLECIEAMEIIFGRDAVIDFCRCNAWKYIWRWKNKNGEEDLEKAQWYLTRAFDMLDCADTRSWMVRRMIHYVNTERGVKESDG